MWHRPTTQKDNNQTYNRNFITKHRTETISPNIEQKQYHQSYKRNVITKVTTETISPKLLKSYYDNQPYNIHVAAIQNSPFCQ